MSSAKFEPRISAVQSALVSKPRDKTLGTFAAALYLFSIGLIAGGVVLAPADQPTRWFDEKQTLTSYSALLLYTSALVSFLNYVAAQHVTRLRPASDGLARFWLLGVAGFFFLMADEFFVMHEGMSRFLTYRVFGLPHSAMADKLDAFIIGAYGLAGLAALAYYWGALRHISGFFTFLAAGAGFAAVSILFDLTDGTAGHVYIEEGTKVLANASFLLACFAAVLNYYRQLEIRLTSVRVAEQFHQTSGADAA